MATLDETHEQNNGGRPEAENSGAATADQRKSFETNGGANDDVRAGQDGRTQRDDSPNQQDPGDDSGKGGAPWTCRGVSPYFETDNGVFRTLFDKRGNPQGEVQLANFRARIVGDTCRDDGAETSRIFEIEAQYRGELFRCTVAAERFATMGWVAKYLPSGADICPGSGIADHARYAIKQLSFTTQQRRIFAHVGWRQIDGRWVYLHSNGAIGKVGDIGGVEVELPPELSHFDLELPVDEVEAVRSSLKLR